MEFAYNASLPIYQHREEIIQAILDNQVIIVAGETGCGKTTHLPLMCLEALGTSPKRIVCTQPRRIAAISLARYVATLVPGATDTIGYKIRFRDTIKPQTRISFVTDGIVLAETISDPLLKRYDCIIIDEAHERTINIDFLLGYMRWLLPKRPELKLVISSATLDISLFSSGFNHAPVISVNERLFPVAIRYEPVIALWQGVAMNAYVDGAVHSIKQLLDGYDSGDILAFFPTVDDIRECLNKLSAMPAKSAISILPLFGRMTPEEQIKIFDRGAARRIVLATNIAETSITVPNIRFVVDTGLCRSVAFDAGAGINRMPISAISQASANQRAGRCGRVREGVCIRLYSEQDLSSRPKFTLPEIRRVNCAGVLLRMADLDISHPKRFPFLQPPSPAAMDAGYKQLRFLGAFDKKGNLTNLGKAMSRLPLDPAVARMLLFASTNGAFHEVAVIAAALSVNTLGKGDFSAKSALENLSPRGFSSDFMTFIALWQRIPRKSDDKISRRRLADFCGDAGLSLQHVKEWIDVHRQLIKICRMSVPIKRRGPGSYEQIHKALLSAFALNCAERQSNGLYRTGSAHDIMISPGSKLRKDHYPWILFHEIVETKRSYGRSAAAIKSRWIEELFPNQCRTSYENPEYDPETGIVHCLKQVIFNGLYIVRNHRADFGKARPQEAHDLFIEEALLKERTVVKCAFIFNNRRVRDAVDLAQRKLRDTTYYSGDRAIADFYHERLSGIVCDDQLRKLVRSKGDRFLFLTQNDLLTKPFPQELADYPDVVSIAGHTLSIDYCFKPGDSNDGATLVVPLSLFRIVPSTYWQWLLPAFWRPRLKEIFSHLGLSENSDENCDTIISMLKPGKGGFIDQAIAYIDKVFCTNTAIGIKSSLYCSDRLWLRVSVVDDSNTIVGVFRPSSDPDSLSVSHVDVRRNIFSSWCTQWEKDSVEKFDESVFKEVFFYPPLQKIPFGGITALAREDNRVSIRVFLSLSSAYVGHRQGVKALVERALADRMAWAWRDFSSSIRFPLELDDIVDKSFFINLVETLFHEIVLALDYELPVAPQTFDALIQTCTERVEQALKTAIKAVTDSLAEYKTCKQLSDKLCASSIKSGSSGVREKELSDDLEDYRSILAKPRSPIKRTLQAARYLKGFGFRIQFAFNKPLRYDENMSFINELKSALISLRNAEQAAYPKIMKMLDDFELMIEEYCIMVFAGGHVPLSFPVSEQRLERTQEEIKRAIEFREIKPAERLVRY